MIKFPGGAGFVHLHVHSSYSLREGAMSVAKLAKLAAADSMPALAMTDSNNLFGALEFSEKLAKEGVQPIAGLQITLDFHDGAAMAPRGEASSGHASLVLLAQDATGYLNLMHLASRAWLDPSSGRSASCRPGPARRANGRADRADRRPHRVPSIKLLPMIAPSLPVPAGRRLQRLFPERLYVEIQRHGLASERAIEPRLLDLAYRASLPLVATNEVFFAAAVRL